MVATCVGTFVACFVFGIQDRHVDNILVLKDGTVLNIDFGWIFGVGPTIDAGLGIPPSLKKYMGERAWNDFVELSVRAWEVLARPQNAYFLLCLLSQLFPEENVEFVKERLLQRTASQVRTDMRAKEKKKRTKRVLKEN